MARIQSLTTIPSVSNTDVLAIEHNTGTGTYKVPISMLLSNVYSKSEAVAKADIVDNLTSTLTTAPLSANMGKMLNDNMLICGNKIAVSCDTSAVGIFYAGFTIPQAPSGYARIGYLMEGDSYRIAALGVGADRWIYYVNTPYTVPINCYITPVYRKT